MSSSSSPPPPPATENDVDGEASRPGHDAAGTAIDAGAVASQTASPSHREADSSVPVQDLYMEDLNDYDSDEHHMVNDAGDVDLEMDEEEGGKFSESAEVEATVEALWRKVVSMEEMPSAGHACTVCMDHITCEGAHRICCIPCGHVYGKSCLERWLQRRAGNETAKCPQCGTLFADTDIIDLYAPGNLWDGCGHLQEVKVYVTKAIAEVVVQCERQLEAMGTEAKDKVAKLKEEHLSGIKKVHSQVRELEDLMALMKKERLLQKQTLDAALEEVRADMELIKGRVSAGNMPPPTSTTEPAQLQEQEQEQEDPPPAAQESRPRRIVKPNKRFYSNEWAR